MACRLLFFLAALALSLAGSPARAADDAAKAPEVSYSELLVKLDAYEGKKVKVKGTFHYFHTSEPVFEIQMGGQPVDILVTQLPPEAQKTVRSMRDFSETPLTVTGLVREGTPHANPIEIVAEQIGVEGESTHYAVEPDRGVVTYPEIVRLSSRYLHTVVIMEGRFDVRDPNRQIFTLWRGLDSIEVDFSRVNGDVRQKLLAETPFSNQPLSVKGIVRPAPVEKGRYLLEALSVDYPGKAAPGGAPTAEATYGDLLAAPPDARGRAVKMRGAFDFAEMKPFTFQMRQGGDSIEVVYEKLPLKTKIEIAGLSNFSRISLIVTGTAKPYPDDAHRFFLIADQVEILSQ